MIIIKENHPQHDTISNKRIKSSDLHINDETEIDSNWLHNEIVQIIWIYKTCFSIYSLSDILFYPAYGTTTPTSLPDDKSQWNEQSMQTKLNGMNTSKHKIWKIKRKA